MNRPVTLAAALVAAATLSGCLERDERITVSPDGALEIVLRLKGDAGEFGPVGDALPGGAPWLVTDRDVRRDDGQGTEHVREARARFARAEDVPTHFGEPGDEASLRFSTALQIERLPDGAVRYTFERRYEPRLWSWRERLLERHLPQEVRDRLAGKTQGPMDERLKRAALAGLLAFERAKGQALVERSLGAIAPAGEEPAVTARRALRARAAYGAAFEAAWRVEDLQALLGAPRSEQVALEARYREETRRLAVQAAADAAVAEGAAPGARAALADALGAAFDLARARVEATEDLQDESFVVRVTFPGLVELSDADALEDDGRTAVFRFHGKDLADQPHVLRAVAVARP